MDRHQGTTIDAVHLRPPAEVLDHVNEHLRRWEKTLRTVDAEGFYVPLCERGLATDEFDHFVIFEDHAGERRLIEVELRDGAATERLLMNAPRTIRVEALRRLPKAFEGVLIRRRHGT